MIKTPLGLVVYQKHNNSVRLVVESPLLTQSQYCMRYSVCFARYPTLHYVNHRIWLTLLPQQLSMRPIARVDIIAGQIFIRKSFGSINHELIASLRHVSLLLNIYLQRVA